MNRADLLRLTTALAIGTVGGALFFALNMPLAWMMGAMVLTTIAALSKVPLYVPGRLRSAMIAILGVLLGSTFTPEALDKVAEWPITLASLALYLLLVTGMLYVYFRRVMGFDPATAYFSATPGGLNEMVIVGRAMGGDDRAIALVHGARILLVVLVLPFSFRYAYGVGSAGGGAGTGTLSGIGWLDGGVLVACAVVGPVIGKFLRLPAYRLVGPMLASAAVHIGGVTSSAPPMELVAMAQVIIGSAIGARFAGAPLKWVFKIIASSLVSTSLMLGATVGFALVLAPLSGIPFAPVVLAFSPGGLAEMSLIALALGVETAFVATHHVARIGMIVIFAPLVFRKLGLKKTNSASD
ncbi:MAG: AbrB family transcriptional regulator [Gammaproteobacteria bacterium]|jgi:membrane AbrB-like protein|nr:AbrB family transcriptional regulator [Gammaproteobacteria bacterium]MDX2460951.1 AbrB family transcriptional regulator [Gammaproteobacteria bacterium]